MIWLGRVCRLNSLRFSLFFSDGPAISFLIEISFSAYLGALKDIELEQRPDRLNHQQK